jgi:uncharacterized BrkB/YihY/UPF0761 family membrane protein
MSMSEREPSGGGAVGWITFAGCVMIISGGFSIIQGFSMLLHSSQFPNQDSLFSQNAKSWGWVTLIIGAIVLVSGVGVFSGNVLARTVGVIGASLSALGSFTAIGLYPVWAILIIAVDIAVIWALTAHGRDIQKMQRDFM